MQFLFVVGTQEKLIQWHNTYGWRLQMNNDNKIKQRITHCLDVTSVGGSIDVRVAHWCAFVSET